MMLPQKLHVGASPKSTLPAWRGRPRPRLVGLFRQFRIICRIPQIAFSTALSAACGNLIGTKYSSGYK